MSRFKRGDKLFLIPDDDGVSYMEAEHLEITLIINYDNGISYRFGPTIKPPLRSICRVYQIMEKDLVEFLDSVTYDKYNEESKIKTINKSIESKKQELNSNIKDIELLELAKSKNHEIINYLELSITNLKDNIDAAKHFIGYNERKVEELLIFNKKLKEFVEGLNN